MQDILGHILPSYFELWHLPVAFAAGMIGEGYATVIGSGGILIQFVLVSLGMPLPVVVATDIAGSSGANFGIIAASPKSIWQNKKLLALLTIPCFIGGVVGTLFLVYIPTIWLKYIIIVGLILLLLYMFLGKQAEVQMIETVNIKRRQYPLLFAIVGFLGIYGNVSGVGVGTFQKISFMSILRISFADSLGIGTISSLPAQLFSLTVTAITGLIAWPYFLMLLLGSYIGANFVTRFVRKIPDAYLRTLLIILAFLYLAYLISSLS